MIGEKSPFHSVTLCLCRVRIEGRTSRTVKLCYDAPFGDESAVVQCAHNLDGYRMNAGKRPPDIKGA